MKTAIVFGSSGLVGQQLVQQLIQNNTYQQSFFNKSIVKYTSTIYDASKKLQNYFLTQKF